MIQANEKNEAGSQVLATLALAMEVCETCELAAKVLAAHEPIGDVASRNAEIIIGALSNGATLLREALDGACEKLEQLPSQEE